ncbi:MAG: hypothetical protein WDA16_00780 [Candidatus Thermoplasmatota archaeon]
MAPFLRDEGPPVSKDTIQRARESLPVEFGFQVVNETGREVLIVRVPKAKPDYLHDLGDVAFYVNLDMIRNCKDILLVGHEKTARVEPQLLRDNIRAQDREDADLVSDLRRRLGRDYAHSILQSPSNFQHQALAVRIPRVSVNDFSPDDVKAIRGVVEQQGTRFQQCQYAYILADRDHERLGKRMVIELLGQTVQVPANQQPLAPAVPVVAVASAPTEAAALASRSAFPMTPGTAMAAAPAPVVDAPPGTLPGFLAAKTHTASVVAPAPPPPPAQMPVLAAPEPMPAAAPSAAPPEVVDTEEYAIISKPKPKEAPAATAPMTEGHPDVERKVSHATEEFEVYTSKPKARAAPSGPAITPPGQGGFQAALDAATAHSGPTAHKTKEYEIMGGGAKPSAADSSSVSRLLHKQAPPTTVDPAITGAFPSPSSLPSVLSSPAPSPSAWRPVDDPRAVPQMPARAAVAPPPSQENGVTLVPKMQAVAPEVFLAQRFKENGYEIVESLRAQGTVFAFAAHKPNGRRVLLKRQAEFGPDEAATLAQLVAALGADICLVVADKVQPGTRLATWGTRIEAYTPSDAATLTF